MRSHTNCNPYIHDEYAPVSVDEELTQWSDVPTLDGVIPDDLHGVLLRNSANPQFIPANRYTWFDGDGFIHGVSFESGRAAYKGRFVRTDKFLEERAAGRSLYGGLQGRISHHRPLEGLRAVAGYILAGTNPFPNTSNTDLIYHSGQLLSLWMLGGEVYVIDPSTLETVDRMRPPAANGIPGGLAAHPKINPIDHALVGMDFAPSWTRRRTKALVLHRRESDGRWSAHKEVELQGSRLLHDMGMTSEHVIILDMPAEMSRFGLRYRRQPTRFGVLRADLEGDIQWFEDPTGCYVIHLVNTFERDGRIVIDALRKPVLTLATAERDATKGAYAADLHRWVLDLRTGRIMDDPCGVSLTKDLPFGFEFPTVSPAVAGLPHRFRTYRP